jgi:hypothetical protein
MMHTSKKLAVRWLMEEAAKFHAEAARDPARADQLLAEYRERYRTDPQFRAEFDEGARLAREEAEHRKRQAVQLLGQDHTRH